MSPIKFTLNGHEYASVEHYFQSEPLRPHIHANLEALQAFNEILAAPDGFAAKRVNKKHSELIVKLWGDTQPSFSDIKTDVMEKGTKSPSGEFFDVDFLIWQNQVFEPKLIVILRLKSC